QLRLDLPGIQDVEQDDLVAVKTQWLDRPNDLVGLRVEVREDHHDSTPLQKRLQMLHRSIEAGARPRLGTLESGEQALQLSLACRGTNVVAHLIVEYQQSGGIALLADGQVEHRR